MDEKSSWRVRALNSNLWKLFIFMFLNEFWVIVPVLLPYYQANGLSMMECLAVQAVYALGIVVFEVPSGYLADRFGRRVTLVFAGLFLVSGVSLYAVTSSFIFFAIAELLVAAGNSLCSGTTAALIYDTLAELKRPQEYASWQGKAEMWMRFGMAMASILGGITAVVSMRLPFFINIGTGAGMALIALLLLEPQRHRMTQGPWEGIINVSKAFLKDRTLVRFSLFGAILRTSGVIGVWLYIKYFQAAGLNVAHFGVILAAFGLVCGFGARSSVTIASKIGSTKVFLIAALVIPSGFVALASSTTLWFIPIALLNGFIWNTNSPLLFEEVNTHFNSDNRATALSFFNLQGSLMYAFCAPLLGHVVDIYSLSTAFAILAALAVIIALISFPRQKVQV